MLREKKIKSSSDVKDFPTIQNALFGSSKTTNGKQGNPDHIFMSDGIPVLLEDKYGTNRHFKGTADGSVSMNQGHVSGYAINGACHYLESLMQNGCFEYQFAIGCSMNDQGEYILSPHLGMYNTIINLPNIEDFSDFTPSKIRRYLARCIEYHTDKITEDALKDTARKLLGVSRSTKVTDMERVLMASLLMFANFDPGFGRTLIGKNPEDFDTVRKHAEGYIDSYTTYSSVLASNLASLSKNKDITKPGKDKRNMLRGMLDIMDSSFIPISKQRDLIWAMISLAKKDEGIERMYGDAAILLPGCEPKGVYVPLADDGRLRVSVLNRTTTKVYASYGDEIGFSIAYLLTQFYAHRPEEFFQERPKGGMEGRFVYNTIIASVISDPMVITDRIEWWLAKLKPSHTGMFIVPSSFVVLKPNSKHVERILAQNTIDAVIKDGDYALLIMRRGRWDSRCLNAEIKKSEDVSAISDVLSGKRDTKKVAWYTDIKNGVIWSKRK